jgi:hypothetical protein
MERKEKEGRKRPPKKKKWKESGVTWREKKRRKKKSGVFGLMLFWYNFLLFADVTVYDWGL